MIDIENLRKSFGDVEVLKGINLTIKEKEVVVIIGPSGSGKSTLLRCMNYLEEPTSGEVSVDGIVLDGEANINKVREEVGMVFQRFNLFPHMTVLQNIMLAPIKVRHVAKQEAEDTARKLLARVGLADKADAYPSQLSGGQQQRVAIARALAMKRRSCCSTSRLPHSTRRWSAKSRRHAQARRRGYDDGHRHARDGLCARGG